MYLPPRFTILIPQNVEPDVLTELLLKRPAGSVVQLLLFQPSRIVGAGRVGGYFDAVGGISLGVRMEEKWGGQGACGV